MVTKPLVFQGQRLILNYSTSAAGSICVEIQVTKPAGLYTGELFEALRGLVGASRGAEE